MKIPRASIKLDRTGLKFRRQVLKEYQLNDTHDLRRLDLASHCLDRIEECREVIEAEGAFIFDRFKQRRENPALKAERDQKVIFLRIIRELGLDLNVSEDSRPRPKY